MQMCSGRHICETWENWEKLNATFELYFSGITLNIAKYSFEVFATLLYKDLLLKQAKYETNKNYRSTARRRRSNG